MKTIRLTTKEKKLLIKLCFDNMWDRGSELPQIFKVVNQEVGIYKNVDKYAKATSNIIKIKKQKLYNIFADACSEKFTNEFFKLYHKLGLDIKVKRRKESEIE
jgi:hypothetical protein